MRISSSRTPFLQTCFAVAVFIPIAGLNAADPFAGSWKLNQAKSKLDPDHQLACATMRFKPAANGYRLAVEGTHEQGDKVSNTVELNLDGKNHAAPGEAQDTMMSVRRPKPKLIEIYIKSGQNANRNTLEVSTDGKTLTSTIYAKGDKGMAIKSVGVFDRQ